MDKRGTKVVSPLKLTIKKETVNDDIKEFAETAMNELLGWYGYGNNNQHHKKNNNNNNSSVPISARSHSGSNSSTPESPKCNDGCGWCGKPVDETSGLSSAAATFCSELCFSQSRRANFKKNKICDWCRHVRHTVSYVDSQDGSSQLQFCSDKCLNQYKMHIFWKETRAHLDIHPHLAAEESSSATSGTLITPALWMSKCKSPEIDVGTQESEEKPPQTSPLPLISVAHPSKLMSRKVVHKKIKKKTSCTNTKPAPMVSNEMPQDLRVRHTPETQPESPRLPNPHLQNRKVLDSFLPPPTLLVPYPILLPVPIPIPIPIPIDSRILDRKKDECNSREVSSQTEVEISNNSQEVSCSETGKIASRFKKRRRMIIDRKAKKMLGKSRKCATLRVTQ